VHSGEIAHRTRRGVWAGGCDNQGADGSVFTLWLGAVVRRIDRFLTPRRIRDYPRLMLLAMAGVLAGHVLMRSGWLGGLGQIIGHDFIAQYTGSAVFLQDIDRLYDFETHRVVQEDLVAPTPLVGLAPFINPPYVAMAYAPLTRMPLSWAFAAWSCAMLIAAVAAAVLSWRYLTPGEHVSHAVSPGSLIVLTLSCFPFVEGYIVGQNHALTLLLVVLLCVCVSRRRRVMAGCLAGALIYKPHLALGFVIVWACWRDLRALFGFSVVSLLWAGGCLVWQGTQPYLDYVGIGDQLLTLSYFGNPDSIMTTPYGFLTSILPIRNLDSIKAATAVWGVFATAALALIATKHRTGTAAQKMPVLALGVLYPFVASPYAMLHDLVLLLPVFLLLAWRRGGRPALKGWATGSYVATLLLPLVGVVVDVALVSALPMAIAVTQYWSLWRGDRPSGGASTALCADQTQAPLGGSR